MLNYSIIAIANTSLQEKNVISINDITSCGDSTGTIQLLGIDSSMVYEYKIKAATTINSSDAFIMEFNIPTDNYKLTIPLYYTDGYDFVIDWGDENLSPQITNYNSDDLAHTYETKGNYQVKIVGTCPRICFYESENRNDLTKIIQWGNVGFTSFASSFYECSNLFELPNGPITGASNVTDFSMCFFNDSLSTIPENLFSNCHNVTDISSCFNRNLLKNIPENLFSSCPNITDFGACFYMNLLDSIPEKLFRNCPNATDFYFCFAANSLDTLPNNLFSSCTNATSFYSCFYDNPLKNLPNDLFSYCPKANTFYFCFGWNILLDSIPNDFFSNCLDVTNFAYCFYRNVALSGTAPELWLRDTVSSGTGCFCNCRLLTNYDEIPDDWKSTGFNVSSFSEEKKLIRKSEFNENDLTRILFEFEDSIRTIWKNQVSKDSLEMTYKLKSTTSNSFKSSTTDSGNWEIYNNQISCLKKGYHTIEIKGNGYIIDTIPFHIKLKEIPIATIPTGNIDTICNGEGIMLCASAQDSYQWSNGDTTQSIIVNPTISTTYSVVVEQNGCESQPATVKIEVITLPEISISNITGTSNTEATDGKVTIINLGLGELQLYINENSISLTDSIIIDSLAVGNYYAIAENAFGCSSDTIHFSITEKQNSSYNLLNKSGNNGKEINTIKATPNPSDGKFCLEVILNKKVPFRIYMYNATGHRIIEEEISESMLYEESTGEFIFKEDYSLSIISGIYIVTTITSAHEQQSIKIEIK